ncbi:hypothetical protein HAX54_034103 [Datura stramonium]|uniref:Uncharacterized protein n=1 Tax=Datura stramonium TaxID=4076 RepID=A0ABS8VG63_DATST|nr:hypothetical protein [Datura stramonium]
METETAVGRLEAFLGLEEGLTFLGLVEEYMVVDLEYPKGGVGVWIITPSVVCKEKGPCLGKKLRCPAKCYKSYSNAGKGYGYGGGSVGANSLIARRNVLLTAKQK